MRILNSELDRLEKIRELIDLKEDYDFVNINDTYTLVFRSIEQIGRETDLPFTRVTPQVMTYLRGNEND